MAKITKTIWVIEPHTEAKHAILRKYLDAWLPIMTSWNGHVNYIDGFAGPGEYEGGEEGSPIIAIRAIMEHKAKLKSDFGLLFIEADKERCEFLEQKIESIDLPKNISVGCHCGRFDEAMAVILDELDIKESKIAPTFVFIDPFGFSGVPFSIIKRIMEHPRCEVLITFMYEEINRFIGNARLWASLTELFGSDEWKGVINIKDSRRREIALQDIYKKQLETEANIEHVLSFKMTNKANRTDYFLFFGTKNILGLKKMKEAMWRVDETGSFEFSDATYNPAQPTLFQSQPNYQYLKSLILEIFKGKKVKARDLETYILTRTSFRETHYKRQVLKPMERAEEIRVDGPSRRRKESYPDDCTIEFL
jgi:three-Cys-motif partner protein